jgi:uncharacterized membrane protein
VNGHLFSALIALTLLVTADAQEVLKPTDPNDGWKVAATSHAVTIYSRVRAGSPIKEFKASGEVDAPTRVVYEVIADFEKYPHFMPYTVECGLIKREPDA